MVLHLTIQHENVIVRSNELSEGRVPEDGIVRETDTVDVDVHQLGAIVIPRAKGDREADLPQGVSSSTAHPCEGLAETEPFERHMKKAESFHEEQVETGAAVDEGLGDGHIADGGREEQLGCMRLPS